MKMKPPFPLPSYDKARYTVHKNVIHLVGVQTLTTLVGHYPERREGLYGNGERVVRRDERSAEKLL